MKKLFAILLITALLFCFGISASAETQATLYNYYGDNMLFKQNDDAVFAGKAASGTEILCTLTNSAGETVATANTVASADGTFSLSFKAPAGSFEEYTATLSANGEVFDELPVLFSVSSGLQADSQICNGYSSALQKAMIWQLTTSVAAVQSV